MQQQNHEEPEILIIVTKSRMRWLLFHFDLWKCLLFHFDLWKWLLFHFDLWKWLLFHFNLWKWFLCRLDLWKWLLCHFHFIPTLQPGWQVLELEKKREKGSEDLNLKKNQGTQIQWQLHQGSVFQTHVAALNSKPITIQCLLRQTIETAILPQFQSASQETPVVQPSKEGLSQPQELPHQASVEVAHSQVELSSQEEPLSSVFLSLNHPTCLWMSKLFCNNSQLPLE